MGEGGNPPRPWPGAAPRTRCFPTCSKTQPFLYAGELAFQGWEGEKPFTVWWELKEPVPERLRGSLGVEVACGTPDSMPTLRPLDSVSIR